jgi:hypothetical protein
MILANGGCDKVICPVKINGNPNTFVLSDENWGGKINAVYVWTKSRDHVLWDIQARKDISVRHFRIKAGTIPEGFEQIVPPPPKTFTPASGEEYLIGVDAEFKPPAFSLETSWIAD